MFIKESKGRRYCKCSDCNKPYSIKAGANVRWGMETYCRRCAPSLWPSKMPSKKKVTA